MKMKKMVGALALTAALAMGTAPAFAASVSNETNEFDNTDKGSTDIIAKVEKDLNPQIKATVPLQVTVTFGSAGGSDIVGPSPKAYTIKNTGSNAIKVKNVEIDSMDTYFTSDLIVEVDGDWYAPRVTTDNPITSGNYLMFTYKTAGNNSYLTTAHALKDSKAKQGMNNNDTQYYPDAITFNEETIGAGESLGIDLGGSAFFPEAISADNMTDTLCKIKYTIGA